MTHKPRNMDRVLTMFVRQELDPDQLAGLNPWGLYEGKRVRLSRVEATIPVGRREGVEATRPDGTTVFPWRGAAVVGYDDDEETPLDPLSAEDLRGVGFEDDELLTLAQAHNIPPRITSFGTDQGSQMRRLVYLRVLRALMR